MNIFNPTAAQAPSSGLAAVATLTAPTDGTRWVIESITGSCSALPTTLPASVQIAWTDGGVNYTETYYIITGGAFILPWPAPRRYPANQQVTVTLSALGTGIYGTIYPQAHTSH